MDSKLIEILKRNNYVYRILVDLLNQDVVGAWDIAVSPNSSKI